MRKRLDEFLELGQEFPRRIKEQVGKVFVGVETEEVQRVFDPMITTLLSGGHALTVGVPGLGKTALCKGLAWAIETPFGRFQGQPDIFPADILGSFDPKYDPPKFIPGAIRKEHGIILADEINRNTPRTLSAFLEIMEERQFTVEGNTFLVNPLCTVFATQNPLEVIETTELPEAVWDRFMMKLRIRHLSREKEIELARASASLISHEAFKEITPVTGEEEVLELRKKIQETIQIALVLLEYIVDVVRNTRNPQFSDLKIEGETVPMVDRRGHSIIRAGASPRGIMWLVVGSRVEAWKQGRNYVLPEDIKRIAVNILAHRVFLTRVSSMRKSNLAETIVEKVLETTPCPQKVSYND